MNVQSLKQYIIDNKDMIEQILEEAGFFHIKKIRDEYVCGWTYEGQGTSIHININTLRYYDFSNENTGDIITLISDAKNLKFKKTVNLISSIIGIKDIDFTKQKIIKPFGGYYKSISTNKNNFKIDVKTYDDNILHKYMLSSSELFLKDGISSEVQKVFDVGYDVETGRIIVPWRNIDGEIIGIMGRYNNYEVPDGIAKWLPIIEFPKSNALFGFSENYYDIIKKDLCYILESEKAPMQMMSKGINHSIGNGGSIINEVKAMYIKSFGVKRLVLAYDEGVDEEFIIKQCNKLKSNTAFYKNQVGYIYDHDNKFLPKGSKMSPSDLKTNIMKQLIKERIKWI